MTSAMILLEIETYSTKLSLTFQNKMSLVMFKTILIRDLQKLPAAVQKI